MASHKASHATGAGDGEETLRRRNVDSHKDANGAISVSSVEVDDKKSKKVCLFSRTSSHPLVPQKEACLTESIRYSPQPNHHNIRY